MDVMAMLDESEGRVLLQIARESVRHGLRHRTPSPVQAASFRNALADPGACFVSLHGGGHLRGCIGTLEPHRPLAVDVAENAFNAAFRDRRMEPVQAKELEGLAVEIHVLGPLRPLAFDALESLCRALRAGEDGLVLELGARRAVFLPVMWEQLPDARSFVTHLLHKAGIRADDPLAGLRAKRFRAQRISD